MAVRDGGAQAQGISEVAQHYAGWGEVAVSLPFAELAEKRCRDVQAVAGSSCSIPVGSGIMLTP